MIKGFSVCASRQEVRVSGAMPVQEQVADTCSRFGDVVITDAQSNHQIDIYLETTNDLKPPIKADRFSNSRG